MDTTITKATLTVTLEESVNLKGVDRGSKNTVSITDIAEVHERIITVPLTTAGATTKTKIIALDTTASAGTFIKTVVQYIRITNLDSKTSARIQLSTAGDNCWLQLDAGKSIILYNHYLIPTVSEWTVGTNTFTDLAAINAQADAAVDLELFVASK